MYPIEKKSKFYVVWVGLNPGVFDTWDECKKQIHGFKGAKYKSFFDRDTAELFFKNGYTKYQEQYIKKKKKDKKPIFENKNNLVPILKSISVDAACSANPGPFEYRGLHTNSKRVLFQVGPLPGGSNNIGEFLAIVHALILLKKHNRTEPVYSDSKTAIAWVFNKKTNTTIVENIENKITFNLIRKAEKWLQENEYPNLVLKWETRVWGEIVADYGRK